MTRCDFKTVVMVVCATCDRKEPAIRTRGANYVSPKGWFEMYGIPQWCNTQTFCSNECGIAFLQAHEVIS